MEEERARKRLVMSGITSATDLEETGSDLEAFSCYLSGVQSVCSLLESGLSSPSDRTQMITLAKHCLDRVQHISDLIGNTKAKAAPASPTLERRLWRLRGRVLDQPPAAADPTWSTYRAASLCDPTPGLSADVGLDLDTDTDTGPDPDSDEYESIEDNRLVLPPPAANGTEKAAGRTSARHTTPTQRDLYRAASEESIFDGADIVHRRFPIPKPVDELDPSGEVSPLDVARRENERLVATYAIRMQRSLPHVQHNLRLELQRRLTENRQIATMKQQAWLKRKQEARQHHVEIAKRVFSMPDGRPPTPDTLQKQAMFADILEFESAHPWTLQLRQSLDAAPDSARTVENALLHMVLEKSHPLSKLRQRLQYSLFCKVNPLVEQHAHLLEAERVLARPPEEWLGLATPSPEVGRDAAAVPKSDRRHVGTQTATGRSGGRPARGGRDTEPRTSGKDAAPGTETGRTDAEPEREEGSTEPEARVAATEAEIERGDAGTEAGGKSTETRDVATEARSEMERRDASPDPSKRSPFGPPPDGADETPVETGQVAGLWPPSCDDVSEERRHQVEAFRRHLRNVISDTQDGVQLLECLAAAVHPALAGASARPVLQRLLFTPLWPHLLVLFRLANWRQESALAATLARLRAASAPPPDREPRRLLRRLLQAASPADKCRLLVQLVRLLCDSPDGPGGADLLLPRLTELVVHAGAPQLLSEVHFISEFMSDGSFQGEQGYCLTSLQTVLLYLVQQQE